MMNRCIPQQYNLTLAASFNCTVDLPKAPESMRDMARPVKEKENALPPVPEGMEVDSKADVKGAMGKKASPADQSEPSKREPPAYRAAFLLGDGAGMGKGRTLAGFVVENIARGRKKHVWISVSSDLYEGEYPSLTFEHMYVVQSGS